MQSLVASVPNGPPKSLPGDTNRHVKALEARAPAPLRSGKLSFLPTFLSRESIVRRAGRVGGSLNSPLRHTAIAVSAKTAVEKPPSKRYPGEAKGFVEELRFVAMKMHTRDQAKEGEREPESESKPLSMWEPTIKGYLRFLVDIKAVHDALEIILHNAAHPSYAEFKNTGMERSERLAKDLEWFEEQGHVIPETSPLGTSYARYLEEVSAKDPQAFLCHFYNVYFAHAAGGRMFGKKVSEKILGNHELEFYKWDGDLSHLVQNVREKLNMVANGWSREDKDRCLEETEVSFKYSAPIIRQILA